MTAPTPALDFLRKVQVWQEDDANRTAGLVVLMPDREEQSLDGLLAELRLSGPSAQLEQRARSWLVGYREMEAGQRVLTGEQRRELDDIVACIPLWNARERREDRPLIRLRLRPLLAAAILVIAALVIALGGLAIANHARGTNPPPPGQAQGAAPAPVQPGLTALQQFRQDWRVQAGGQPGPGNDPRALVLLENGLYYPSGWAVPPYDAAWAQGDTSDSVAANTIKVLGSQVTFQDGDGNNWTVGTSQPFVLAPNPSTILKIDQNGNVWSMPEPHAITVRTRI